MEALCPLKGMARITTISEGLRPRHTELEARPGLTKEQLLAAMEGHILDEGELVGTYKR